MTRTSARSALVTLLALVAALLPFATADAAITGDDTIYVLSDSNEQASIKQARLAYTPLGPDGPDTLATEALIGRADLFADNLAAGALSGQAFAGGRPLFLNSADDGVSDELLAELDRVTEDGATVHILGGELAQGQGVADALESEGYMVNRFAGETRVETAIAIAEANGSERLLLVRGFPEPGNPTSAFADSMAAGALAAFEGFDMLFTQTDVLTPNTAEAIIAQDYGTVYVVGGPLAISEDVLSAVTELVPDTTRIAGETRFETAIALNELRRGDLGTIAIAVEGTSDDSWAQAVAAANWSGLGNYPLVLSTPDGQHPASQAYIDANHEDGAPDSAPGDDVPAFAVHAGENFLACAGDGALETCTEEAERRGGTASEFDPPVPPPPPPPPGNQSIAVQPQADATLLWLDGGNPDDPDAEDPGPDSDDRAFTATELTGSTYRATLVLADNITIDEDNDVAFADANDDNIADAGPPASDITIVNGEAVSTNHTQGGIAPVDGMINITADADETAECFRTVIYRDGGGSTLLELDDDGFPIEPFGISGITCVVPPEAADGEVFDEVITDVAADGSRASTDDESVFFDAEDTYRLFAGGQTCTEMTAEEFFANLSVNDRLRTIDDADTIGNAPYDADGPNVWCLYDVSPVGPTAVAAVRAPERPDTRADLTWNPEADVDAQNVYLLEDPAEAACEDNPLDDYTLVETLAAAADELSVDELTPDTTYCFAVTSVSGADESDLDAASSDDVTTRTPVTPPTLLSATLDFDEVLEGGPDTGDVWTFTFDQPMASVGALDYYDLEDPDGDVFRVRCSNMAAVDDEADASCVRSDGDDDTVENDTITITLLDDPVDRNAAGDGILLYPATIIDAPGVTDLDDNVAVDLDASPDPTVG